MKKAFFTVSLLLTVFCSVKAQHQFNFEGVVPAAFTIDHKPYIYGTFGESETYHIYDCSFNEVASFDGKLSSSGINYKVVLHESGVGLSSDIHAIVFSQTLFNDDADWEYIEEKRDYNDFSQGPWGVLKETIIKKMDGTIVGRLDATKYWISGIALLVDTHYVVVKDYQTSEQGYFWYTIPQFRRLIAGEDPSRINAKVMDKNAATFDLSGRKVGSDYHGVVVNGNVKKIQ